MSDFELPPSATPDSLFQPEIVSLGWYRQRRVWVAAAIGFVCGMGFIGALMILHGTRDQAAQSGAAQVIDELKPVARPDEPDVPVHEAGGEPAMISTPATGKPVAKKPAPPEAPMPTQVVAPCAQAIASGSTLTLTAQGAGSAQEGISANVYVDGAYVGRAPIKARPVEPGKRVVRFDCIWKGKAHKGDDTVVDVERNMDATVDHKCDVMVWIGVPDGDKAP